MTIAKHSAGAKVKVLLKENDYIFLDRHTPLGLFNVSTGGQQYLIVQHNDRKRAISLTRWDDPEFSVCDLGNERLEFGRWFGPPHLKLTTILRGFVPPLATGIVCTDGDEIKLSCVMPDGTQEWLPIGVVDVPDDFDCQFFNGWRLDDPSSPHPYFERHQGDAFAAQPYIPATRTKCMTRIEVKFPPSLD